MESADERSGLENKLIQRKEEKMERKRRENGSRNAISAGVFIALYLVTYIIIGAICMPVGILFLLMPMIVAVFSAPTYHMMLAKSPSWIPIVIAAVLPSIILIASGHIPIAPIVSVPAGIIAALISRQGEYKDFKKNQLSHMFFSLNLFGGFIPIWVMRDYFFSTLEGGLSEGFEETVRALTPWWMLPVMMVVTMLCSYLGSIFTEKIMAKHLKKAGVM